MWLLCNRYLTTMATEPLIFIFCKLCKFQYNSYYTTGGGFLFLLCCRLVGLPTTESPAAVISWGDPNHCQEQSSPTIKIYLLPGYLCNSGKRIIDMESDGITTFAIAPPNHINSISPSPLCRYARNALITCVNAHMRHTS